MSKRVPPSPKVRFSVMISCRRLSAVFFFVMLLHLYVNGGTFTIYFFTISQAGVYRQNALEVPCRGGGGHGIPGQRCASALSAASRFARAIASS